nr:unnamed protein product [Callosobruchus chinensis]
MSSCFEITHSSSRDKEREQKLENALEAVAKGMSKKTAAKRFGIPRSTIQYRLSDKFKSPGYGPPTVLTNKEEEILIKWIFECHRKGFPRRIDDVQASVQQLIKKDRRETPFKDGRPGKGWYKAFLRRHPEIVERTTEAVTAASAPISEKDIRKWFEFIESYHIEENYRQILNDASRVYNGDETNFLLCPKNKKVLAPKGSKNVLEVDHGTAKASLTVMFSFSASGSAAPPMIIYPYKKNVPKDIADTIPDQWGIGHSDNGWMKSELFVDYILNIFHPYLIEQKVQRPVILFLGGHKTHLTIELSELCSRLEVIIVNLYPNATRILQPADVSAFKPLKTGWLKAMVEWKRRYPNMQFTKANFAPLLQDVVQNYVKPQTIINGFRATGLCPWNADAIDYSKCLRGKACRQPVPSNTVTNGNITMGYADFINIVGAEKIAALKNGHDNEIDALLYKLYSYFQTGEQDKKNVMTDSTLIVNMEVSATEGIDEDTHSGDKELTEEVAKFDKLMETLSNENKISSIESSPQPTCSKTAQIGESPADLNKILYWPPTPVRKNTKNTERKHYVVTSKQFQNEFKTKEEAKKKIENDKLKKKQIREQKKNEKLNKTKVCILSDVEVIPAKKKKTENNGHNPTTPKTENIHVQNNQSNGANLISFSPVLELTPATEDNIICEFEVEPCVTLDNINCADKDLPMILSEVPSWDPNQLILPLSCFPIDVNENITQSSESQSNLQENSLPVMDDVKNETIPEKENTDPESLPEANVDTGICYGCTFNISKKDMGIKCAKCSRKYHLRCFTSLSGVICPKCIYL